MIAFQDPADGCRTTIVGLGSTCTMRPYPETLHCALGHGHRIQGTHRPHGSLGNLHLAPTDRGGDRGEGMEGSPEHVPPASPTGKLSVPWRRKSQSPLQAASMQPGPRMHSELQGSLQTGDQGVTQVHEASGPSCVGKSCVVSTREFHISHDLPSGRKTWA